MMAGSMLAVGAASYISRLLGARKEERASRVFSVAFFSAMAFGAVVMALGLAFLHPMLRLLGATATCEQYAAARPLRNREEEPTDTICPTMAPSGRNSRGDRRRRLRRVR